MTLQYACELTVSFDFDPEEVAKEVIETALRQEGFPMEAEVSLTLASEEEIQAANKAYRGIDRVTDVLSFPMADYETPGQWEEAYASFDTVNPDTGDVLLGDILLCVPKVYAQAEEYGHSVKREYAFLIAHSMLHLMGYDHMEEKERAIMEEKQEEILSFLHINRA